MVLEDTVLDGGFSFIVSSQKKPLTQFLIVLVRTRAANGLQRDGIHDPDANRAAPAR